MYLNKSPHITGNKIIIRYFILIALLEEM